MEISKVEMEHISDQNQKQNVSAIDGFAPRDQGGIAADTHDRQRDVFELDSVRQSLRSLCEAGQAQDHIDEILESGIEPDCLRAELAFRAASGDSPAVSVVLNYLAGNFKEALLETQLLADTENAKKMVELMIFSDYFAGNFDKGCNAIRNLAEFNYSPFLCYAYADMLLSLGYIDDARTYTKRYVILARKYLMNFVSEKEKYENEKSRHEQGSRRGRQNDKGNEGTDKRQSEKNSRQAVQKAPRDENSSQSPALYGTLKDMFARRRVLIDVLKTRNVSIDKRPLMFELEDIDAQIAQINGRFSATGL